jgi:hypothetical protein
MRDAHFVAIDIYRAIQAIQLDLAVNFREGFRRDRVRQITLEIIGTACNQDENKNDNYT